MKLLFIFMLLASFFSGFGQSSKTIHTTRFGLKGGLNHSIVNGVELTGAKTGYIGNELYGSFFSDARMTKKLNLENELLFSWTDDYHFIEIPVHVKYRFTDKWSAFVGPKLDFIADNDNDPNESRFKFRNFGVSGELGVQYNIRNWCFAETRYSESFVKQITDQFLDINNGRRNTFRAGLGITF